MKYKKLILIVGLIFNLSLYSQSNNFEQGELLYKQNKTVEAIPYLLNSLKENPKSYVYLSVCYYQLGQYQNSMEICERGLNSFGTDKKVLAYNAGNSCFAANEFSLAEKYYNIAISADGNFADPVLNRGNTYVKQGKYQEAIADYEKYMRLRPNDEQNPQIITLISLLKEEMVNQVQEKQRQAEENQRLQEEEARIQALIEQQAEEARLEQQRKMAADAERRRRLLDDVASSLQSVEAENMTAGAEGTFGYEYEDELE